MTRQRMPLDFNRFDRRLSTSPSRSGFPGTPIRRRYVAAGITLLVLLTTAIRLNGSIPAAEPPAAGQPVAAAAPETPAPVMEAVQPEEQEPAGLTLTVRDGDTLDALFRHHDLSIPDLAQLLTLPDARQHLRILRPGDVISIEHEEGRVVRLEREVSIDRALQVSRDEEEAFQAEIIELPIEIRLNEAFGRISRSLFEAGVEARISDRLIMNLTDVFKWDIDFVRDIGIGDEFTLLYEELWRDGQKLGERNILAAEFVNRGSRYTAVRFEEEEGRPTYYSSDGRPLQKAFLRVPVSFTRISSEFNPRRRHPILNTIRAHRGVDYAAPAGTPVKAAGDGKIIFRGWKSGYGNTVIIQHGGNVTTLYAHLSRFATDARYGSRVRQSDVVAFVGATGLATAPHLHYEYRRNGVHLNPRTVDLPEAEPLTGQRLAAFRSEAGPLLERLQTQRTLLAANRPEI